MAATTPEDGGDLISRLRAIAAETAARLSARRQATKEANELSACPTAGGEGGQPSQRAEVDARCALPFDLPPLPPPAKRMRLPLPPPPVPDAAAAGGSLIAAYEAECATHLSAAAAVAFALSSGAVVDPGEYEVVQVPDDIVGLFIGKAGCGIKRVQAETGANVVVGKLSVDGFRKVCLTGSPEVRQAAKAWVEHWVATVPRKKDFVSEVIEVPEMCVRDLIGPKGCVIKGVREATGVSASVDKECVPGGAVRRVSLRGPEEAIGRAREQVERILFEAHRRQGIFNPALEEKFGAFAQQQPSPPLVPSHSETVFAAHAGAHGLHGRGGGGAAAASVACGAAPHAPVGDFGAWPTMDIAAQQYPHPVHGMGANMNGLEAECAASMLAFDGNDCLPAYFEELSMWAEHYAADDACVAYYVRLRESCQLQGYVGGELPALTA